MNHLVNLDVILAYSVAAVVPTATNAEELGAGEKVFNKCKARHQVGEKAENRADPDIDGIVGQPAGKDEGFRYSNALSNSEPVWDEATLAVFLADPKCHRPWDQYVFRRLAKRRGHRRRVRLFDRLQRGRNTAMIRLQTEIQ